MGFGDSLKKSFRYACTPPNPISKKESDVAEVSDKISATRSGKAMKKLLVALCLLAVVLVSYEVYKISLIDDWIEKADNRKIEAVKEMTVDISLFNMSGQVGEGVVKMAGIDGTVKWSTFKPEKFKDNSNISGVKAVVNCKGKKGKPHTATFDFLVNSESGYMELTSYVLDGKAKTGLDAKMTLITGSI